MFLKIFKQHQAIRDAHNKWAVEQPKLEKERAEAAERHAREMHEKRITDALAQQRKLAEEMEAFHRMKRINEEAEKALEAQKQAAADALALQTASVNDLGTF